MFSAFMDEGGRRFFSRMKNSGRHRKPSLNCQSKGQDGEAPLKTRMNSRRSGTTRVRHLFGYFLGAQKVTCTHPSISATIRTNFANCSIARSLLLTIQVRITAA